MKRLRSIRLNKLNKLQSFDMCQNEWQLFSEPLSCCMLVGAEDVREASDSDICNQLTQISEDF